MRRRTITRASLAATLLMLGTFATTGVLPAAADSSPAAAPASAALLAAMQRDFGLTKPQAEARLAAEKTATAAEPKARRAAGASYGGSWFDAGSGRLSVAVTSDASPATLRAVRATGATVRTAAHSARQLDATRARLDKLDAPDGVSGWHVDPKGSSVVVSVVAGQQGDNDVEQFLDRARAAGPVTVEKTASAPSTFAAGTVGGDPYYTGNVRLSLIHI